MNMTKSFKTLEVMNIVAYINKTMTPEQVKELPTKFRWNLKKNLDKLIPIATNYEEFRDTMVAEFNKEWFDEEHSIQAFEPILDGDGNPVLNEDGSEQTQDVRKIKEECMDEFTSARDELNKKLQEILFEENELEISTVDFDAFVDNLPDDTKIDFDCLNILCFMDNVTGVKGAE